MRSDPSAPLVSVVIAAYNAEAHLAATLDSVRAQTFTDYEVIVVDDGSTDGTGALAEAHGARVIRQENRGQPAARNTGIRAARGCFVAFVDADDLWLPEKLKTQMALIEKEGVAWAYSNAVAFESETGRVAYREDEGKTLHEGEVFRPLLLGNFIPSPTPVVRRDVFEAVGYFSEDPATHNGEDWDMWLRIAAEYPVARAQEPLVRYRLHSASMTGSMDLAEALESRLRIVARAAARHPRQAAGMEKRARARLYAMMGRKALNREERPAALRWLTRALRYEPANALTWTLWMAAFLPRPLLRLLGRVRERVPRLQQWMKGA